MTDSTKDAERLALLERAKSIYHEACVMPKHVTVEVIADHLAAEIALLTQERDEARRHAGMVSIEDRALMKRAGELMRTSELPHNKIATLEERVALLTQERDEKQRIIEGFIQDFQDELSLTQAIVERDQAIKKRDDDRRSAAALATAARNFRDDATGSLESQNHLWDALDAFDMECRMTPAARERGGEE